MTRMQELEIASSPLLSRADVHAHVHAHAHAHDHAHVNVHLHVHVHAHVQDHDHVHAHVHQQLSAPWTLELETDSSPLLSRIGALEAKEMFTRVGTEREVA